MGTLTFIPLVIFKGSNGGARGRSPDKVTKTEDENAYTSKLDGTSQVGIEIFDEGRKHWRQSQWTESLRERCHGCCRDARRLPLAAPVERIIRIIARLGHQNLAMSAFDEVM
jgi:hypothetical protein